MGIKTFLNRPILSGVISVLIVIVGIIGLTNLPMEQYPDIAPPTIVVSTTYTGASANAVLKSVIVPLEDAINGVEDMAYMTSSATNTGSGSVTITFNQDTDPDMALINVKNRVSQAEGKLPQEVTKIGVTVQKRQNSTLKIISLYSPTDKYSSDFISNYFKINIEPRLLRIKGVGNVELMGSEYAMRIWLNPEKMANYGLEPSDIQTALSSQNIEAATGTLGEDSKNTFQYTLKYRGRLENSTQFDDIVIKSMEDGQVVRLKDVAKTELGTTNYAVKGDVNSHNGVSGLISQTAGSNAHEINKQIDKLIDETKEQLPDDLKFVNLMDTNDFLNAAMSDVFKTLIETILLVILVVYVFLQSARSTIIPAISIIVSLVGTFAFMYIAGFSLNLLTLFALVLVIGTVVDDAIVVVEAVQSKFDEGYRSPYAAANNAMSGISTAIVTTSLVFMAVFIPTSFMGGTSGTYYQQFGLTMAVAVGISAINALTLCPMLCSLLMTPQEEIVEGRKASFSTRFNKAFNTSFHTLVSRYQRGLSRFFKHRWIAWSLLATAVVGLAVMMNTTKTGLIPDEDMGTMFVCVNTPVGSTLEQTEQSMKQVGNAIKGIPEIENYSAVAGYSMMGGQAVNGGSLIVKLKNWNERKRKGQDINSVIGQVMVRTANIKSASIFAFAQPTIMGYSTSNGVELYIQDHEGKSTEKLMNATRQFISILSKRSEISQAYTSYDIRYPQYIVDVDAAQCLRYGVQPTAVLNVLNGYVGGSYASNFNAFNKLYRVMVQASPDMRLDKDALDNMYVKTSSGGMTPVGQFIHLTKTYGPEQLNRFNLYNSISVNVMPATGYSSGDVIKAITEVSKQTLPQGYGYEYTGMTREESNSSNNTVMVFAICIVFIYLLLCALYESLFIPLAVLFSVPFGLLGSFIFANIFGISNNVYLQVGLIMLIGLLSKTAILLTEYATTRRREGMTITQAAMSAAKVRLRPILMTALTMIVGMLPLALSSGAGANGNIALSVGVIGGMSIGTVSLLFMVPVFFIAFQTLEEKLMPKRDHSLEVK
jgi:hydrophobe/amphiphile efflux-1 (HAE1) family protein